MVSDIKKPFDLELILISAIGSNRLHEITNRDIYEQNANVFNKNGLFSTIIFGEIGSLDRYENYGYINTHLKILHPLIYRHVIGLKSLYKDIIESKRYVIYDEKENDFVESNKIDGNTGYSFFIKYFDKIKYKETGSKKRANLIKFIKKYSLKDVYMDKWLVLPAGYRDYVVTNSGKILEDSINDLYRKLLTLSSTAKQISDDSSNPVYVDGIRLKIQKTVYEIYAYIENILEGKEGYIRGKWVKRSIMYGTRNVLTAPNIKMDKYGAPNVPKFNDTSIGIYQYVKGVFPLYLNKVRDAFLNSKFTPESNNSYLVNRKTLKKEIVSLSEKSRSNWITDEGLEKTINKLIQDELKINPVIIDDHYLYLVYDDGKTINIIEDIESLPDGKDPKYVRPLKYIELLYLPMINEFSKYPAVITRYPVTGYGSTYPSNLYCKTTINGRKVKYTGPNSINETVLYEYPDFKSKYYNSMSVHTSHLHLLGADYDGLSLLVHVK